MNSSVSPRFVREQWPAISGMTTGLIWSLTPPAVKNRLVDMYAERQAVVSPGTDALVEAYLRWCGVEDDRYAGVLPPHFFSKYGMNMMARLTGMVPYNMLSVVNQGCHLRVQKLLPRGEPIHLRGRLLDCTRDGNRVRVHTQVIAGTRADPDAMSVDTVAAVMLGPSARKKTASRPEVSYMPVGSWSADRHEGQRFFYLTGDFNPIHTFWPFARRTRFGGCILHGFGTLARTFECIQTQAGTINDFDARFVRPNLLPSGPNLVEVATDSDTDGRRGLRLTEPQGAVLLGGSYRLRDGEGGR